MVGTATCAGGALKAHCDGEPARISVCHCLDRQRRSGSAFADPAFPEPRFSVYEERRRPWVRIETQAPIERMR